MHKHWWKDTCDEKYFVDRDGETDVDVFPLGIETIDADELVSDWCIGLKDVVPWFNSVIKNNSIKNNP